MQVIRVLIALGLAATLGYPALAEDGGTRTELKRVSVPEHPDLELVTMLLEIKPGESLARHIHDGLEAVYVTQGAMAQRGDRPAFEVKAGSTELHLFRAPHGGFKVVGETPLKFFVVRIVEKGKPDMELVP